MYTLSTVLIFLVGFIKSESCSKISSIFLFCQQKDTVLNQNSFLLTAKPISTITFTHNQLNGYIPCSLAFPDSLFKASKEFSVAKISAQHVGFIEKMAPISGPQLVYSFLYGIQCTILKEKELN